MSFYSKLPKTDYRRNLNTVCEFMIDSSIDTSYNNNSSINVYNHIAFVVGQVSPLIQYHRCKKYYSGKVLFELRRRTMYIKMDIDDWSTNDHWSNQVIDRKIYERTDPRMYSCINGYWSIIDGDCWLKYLVYRDWENFEEFFCKRLIKFSRESFLCELGMGMRTVRTVIVSNTMFSISESIHFNMYGMIEFVASCIEHILYDRMLNYNIHVLISPSVSYTINTINFILGEDD